MPLDSMKCSVRCIPGVRRRCRWEGHIRLPWLGYLNTPHCHQFHQLWVAVPVLKMGHQGESLPFHSITPSPHTGDVVTAQRTVRSYGVVFNFLRCLECLHTCSPLAQEWFLCVYFDLWLWRGRRAGGR